MQFLYQVSQSLYKLHINKPEIDNIKKYLKKSLYLILYKKTRIQYITVLYIFIKNIILAYRSYVAFIANPTKFLLDTSNLINNFHTFIINYEVIQKSIKKIYLNKNKDNKLYFMNY